MRRSIRTRADAAQVANRVVRDTRALWMAVRHTDGRSPIRDDEIVPIHTLRNDARAVARLLARRPNGRKNGGG